MSAAVRFDTEEFVSLAHALRNVPGDIKTKAMARAMRRVATMARTRVVRRSAERIDVPQKFVREVTRAHFNAGGNTADVILKSGWIPLYKIGARETKRGVTVKGRGSIHGAFIAGMKSGHRGVFRRVGASRLPIRELFGPNPAHDVMRNDEVYLQVVSELMEEYLAPRVLHEVDRILARLSAR